MLRFLFFVSIIGLLSANAATPDGGVTAGAAGAAVAGPLSNDDVMRQLLEELRALRSRVQALESKLDDANSREKHLNPADSVVSAAELSGQSHAETHGNSPVDADTTHAQHSFLSSPRLNFHGYADLGYPRQSRQQPEPVRSDWDKPIFFSRRSFPKN